jgi:hypothetical protein
MSILNSVVKFIFPRWSEKREFQFWNSMVGIKRWREYAIPQPIFADENQLG